MDFIKAIQLVKVIVLTGEYHGDPDDSDALKLAIATMIAYRNIREDIGQHLAPILLGETQRS